MNPESPRRRGYAMISLLMGFLLLAVLMGMYNSPDPVTGKPYAISQIDRARSTACLANRRGAQANLVMAQMDGGGFQAIQQMASKLPPCPDGGRYFVVKDKVLCTGDAPMAKSFRQQFTEAAAKLRG